MNPFEFRPENIKRSVSARRRLFLQIDIKGILSIVIDSKHHQR